MSKVKKTQKGISPVNNLAESIKEFLSDFWNDASFSLKDFEYSPKIDITENEKNMIVNAEIPGMEQKDINVEIKKNVLTISGEKTEEKERENEKIHRVERKCGSFQRNVVLPSNVDTKKIKATYKNGVLCIEIPKTKQKEKSKKIKVE
jgi:HSP20 family protein